MRRSCARWRPGREQISRFFRITRAEVPTEAETTRPAVRAGQESEAGGERSERGLVRPRPRPRPDPEIIIRAVKPLVVVVIQD